MNKFNKFEHAWEGVAPCGLEGRGRGVPSEWHPCEQTEKIENITFLQLRWRAVICRMQSKMK